MFANQDLELGTGSYKTSEGDTVHIDHFRFYLSGFVLVYEDGTQHTIKNSYHLVDAEVPSTLDIVFKKVPHGRINGVQFNIGVDSIKSVSGAFNGDLDPMHGMYWAWNSGYINAKLEGRSNSCQTHKHGFEFHVGGYAFPNNSLRRTSVHWKNVNESASPEKIVVAANVAHWFINIKLSTTNAIMIPGKAAQQLADKYKNMFSMLNVYEN